MASHSNTFPVESQSAMTVPGLISQLTVAVKNREGYLMDKIRDLEDTAKKASQENASHAQMNQILNENLLILQKRYAGIQHSNNEYADKIKHLNSQIEMMGKELNKKQNEIEILRKGKNKGSEIDPARKVNLEYEGRIKILSFKKEASDDDPKNRQSENDAVRIPWSNSVENRAETIGPPPGFKEIVNCKQRSYPKCPEILEIEDDDDGLKHVSSFKRKQGSNEIKKEDNNDECISVNKHASKKIKSKCDDDLVGSIAKGTQPVSITYSEKVSPFLDAFGSSSVIVKKEKHDEGWKSEAHMLEEFKKDDELCLNAICALHRQSIKTTHTSLSAHISRGHGISRNDTLRINTLAHLVIDGDPQQKMKKKPSELYPIYIAHSRVLANMYSAHLFEIYKKKVDPFFPPSRMEDK